MIAMAMRQVASDPDGVATRNRPEIMRGVRSFHMRHTRFDDQRAKMKRPVHVLYYRVIKPGLIEIVRVLHERMEPTRRIGEIAKT
jgi:toxin ParE1/3/4